MALATLEFSIYDKAPRQRCIITTVLPDGFETKAEQASFLRKVYQGALNQVDKWEQE